MSVESNLTLQSFGYLPENLPEFSTKSILIKCDFCNNIFKRKKFQFSKPSRKNFPHACEHCDSVKSNWKRNNPDGFPPEVFLEIFKNKIQNPNIKYVDIEATIEKYKYDPATLAPRSEKKVVVKCSFCNSAYDTSLSILGRTKGLVCCKSCASLKSVFGQGVIGPEGESPQDYYLANRKEIDFTYIDKLDTKYKFGYELEGLSAKSEKKIVAICHNCSDRFITRLDHFTSSGSKMSCAKSECRWIKTQNTLMIKHGVSHSMDIPSVKEKLAFPTTERIVNNLLKDNYKLTFVRGYTIGPYSFDFYLPDYNLLIECQGDYFHDFKKNGYAGTARDKAKSTYISNYTTHKLIWIWEHEIHMGRLKKILDFHLGATSVSPIDGDLKSINIRSISQKDAYSFLSLYHYLGTLGSVASCFGAYYEDEIVSVCVFGGVTRNGSIKHTAQMINRPLKSNQIREIKRFAIRPNVKIPNLGSFLMSKFIREFHSSYPLITHIISFSDPNVGDIGGLYRASNFKCLGETSPSYHYMDGNKAIHKRTVYELAIKAKMKESEFANNVNLVKIREKPKIKWLFEL